MPIKLNDTIAKIPLYPQASTYAFGGPLVKMSSNESPFSPHPAVAETITAAGRDVNRYPDPSGAAFREKLAQTYDMAVEQIVLGNGSCEILLAGAQVLRADSLTQLGPQRPALIYLNSPSNPTGKVLPLDHLRKVVNWARDRGVLIASDECYLGLSWEAEPLSVLHPSVCDGDHTGLLAVHSLSKTSSLAGYRAGFVAGDPAVVAELLAVRKHAGMMVPTAVQAAMVAALDDDEHEALQRERYAQRRAVLLPALQAAGFTIEHSEAGLYLWATRGEPCRDTVKWLAERGILVAPGEFYGPAGAQYVRVALTATDERIAAAVARLA